MNGTQGYVPRNMETTLELQKWIAEEPGPTASCPSTVLLPRLAGASTALINTFQLVTGGPFRDLGTLNTDVSTGDGNCGDYLRVNTYAFAFFMLSHSAAWAATIAPELSHGLCKSHLSIEWLKEHIESELIALEAQSPALQVRIAARRGTVSQTAHVSPEEVPVVRTPEAQFMRVLYQAVNNVIYDMHDHIHEYDSGVDYIEQFYSMDGDLGYAPGLTMGLFHLLEKAQWNDATSSLDIAVAKNDDTSKVEKVSITDDLSLKELRPRFKVLAEHIQRLDSVEKEILKRLICETPLPRGTSADAECLERGEKLSCGEQNDFMARRAFAWHAVRQGEPVLPVKSKSADDIISTLSACDEENFNEWFTSLDEEDKGALVRHIVAFDIFSQLTAITTTEVSQGLMTLKETQKYYDEFFEYLVNELEAPLADV